MDITVVRAETLTQRAGAYYVRIQALARKYHITLEQEFDEHDELETRYIVLLDHDFPVATCRFYGTGEGSIMLGRVVVLPEYHGQGLGKRTVREAEQWARELGFRRVVLESRVGKTGFYQKLGYTADGSQMIEGEIFTCIRMEKML